MHRHTTQARVIWRYPRTKGFGSAGVTSAAALYATARWLATQVEVHSQCVADLLHASFFDMRFSLERCSETPFTKVRPPTSSLLLSFSKTHRRDSASARIVCDDRGETLCVYLCVCISEAWLPTKRSERVECRASRGACAVAGQEHEQEIDANERETWKTRTMLRMLRK